MLSVALGSNDKCFSVKGIPTYITDDHDEVLRYWEVYNDSDLLHVDAHHDMEGGVEQDLGNLNIGNFICPAVHYGIVSNVHWLNPQSNRYKLLHIGSKERGDLRTELRDKFIYWDVPSRIRTGSVLTVEDGVITLKNKYFILDIDLDAFCCQKAMHNTSYNKDGINGYEERIEYTRETLKRSKRPDIITMTRSVGCGGVYVPEDKVDIVQELTLKMLETVF